jgi:predicted TIM-barrel fold metal-dependent hydrolase
VTEKPTGASRLAALAPQPPHHEDIAPVRAFWEGLGLPGLFDVHVHFLPPTIQKAVWDVFDSAGPKIGREWPIRYRASHEVRVELLREMGVRRFSTLPYAHKPGVAAYLNDWSRAFAMDVPEVLWSATFFPEDGVQAYVGDLVGAGVELFKLHLQVGEFHLDDPLLDDVWGLIEDADVPVLVHAGSGPVGNDFTGPASMQRLLARHPRLPVIVAHMGAPEVVRFLRLAEEYDRVRLDTTMVFTDFFGEPYPQWLVPRLVDLQPKVLLGTDFPTIPYPYAHQLEGLARLDLGDDWLRAVCWENGAELFGLSRRAAAT